MHLVNQGFRTPKIAKKHGNATKSIITSRQILIKGQRFLVSRGWKFIS